MRTVGRAGLYAPTASTTARDSEPGSYGLRPAVVTERLSLCYRFPERLDFGLGLGLVHELGPPDGAPYWPFAEIRRRAFATLGETGPLPVFGLVNEPCSKGIPLDVATYPQEMPVVSDGYRPEATLIDCPLPIEVAERLPSSGMSGRKPVHESREGAVRPRR